MKKSLIVVLLLVCINGCTTEKILVDRRDALAKTTDEPSSEYRIQTGDQLDIKFFYNPELNENVVVRPDGKISLQLINEVQAAGQTPTEIGEVITAAYSKELREPKVTVIVRSFKSSQIYVGGEVGRPGLLNINGPISTLQAIINAGGFLETANPEEIIIIRKGPGNRPILYPVNLGNTLDNDSESIDPQLQSYDIVYVPKSGVARADKFVDQYIRKLIPFSGFGYNIQ
jgi:protein involved in polysaccharide export with SLBB domain